MIRLTLVSNALHLEAARRLRHRTEGGHGSDGARIDVLIWEPRRMRLNAEDRRLWRLRLPVGLLTLALLLPLALTGLVGEMRLAHLHNAGRALRGMAARSRRLVLIDDGLDQYRSRPRAVDPDRFAAGTPYWLFSDAPAARAPWCRRFACRELGPLYGPCEAEGGDLSMPPTDPPDPAWAGGTLIIDSPGVERLHARASELPRPWTLVPHPVVAKRSWRLPLQADDRVLRNAPETLLARWSGTVLVGESLMMLAALRLCRRDITLLLSLPKDADPNLLRLAAAEEQLAYVIVI